MRPGSKTVVDDEDRGWRLHGTEKPADERGMRDASVQPGDQASVDADVISIFDTAMDCGCLVAGDLIQSCNLVE